MEKYYFSHKICLENCSDKIAQRFEVNNELKNIKLKNYSETFVPIKFKLSNGNSRKNKFSRTKVKNRDPKSSIIIYGKLCLN